MNDLINIPVPALLRSRDAARTREAILRAAQKLFAGKGYLSTGVREVAAEAGINSALVRRYYQSKEGLLRAAIEDLLIVEPFICGSRAEFGVRAVSILLIGDEHPNFLSMMMLATADPAGRVLCRDLLYERFTKPLAEWIGTPDGEERAVRLHMLWSGFITMRHIIPLQPVTHQYAGPTLEWLAVSTQWVAFGNSEGQGAKPAPSTPQRD